MCGFCNMADFLDDVRMYDLYMEYHCNDCIKDFIRHDSFFCKPCYVKVHYQTPRSHKPSCVSKQEEGQLLHVALTQDNQCACNNTKKPATKASRESLTAASCHWNSQLTGSTSSWSKLLRCPSSSIGV